MSVLFKIGSSNDYTANVVDGTYKINSVEVTENYKDCNEVTHFIMLRNKISGTLDLAFKTQTDYSAFITAFAGAKVAATNSWPITVTPNNTLVQTQIDARVTFEPVRELTAKRTDIIRRMTVNIEER